MQNLKVGGKFPAVANLPEGMDKSQNYFLLGEALAAEDEDRFIAAWATSSIFGSDQDAPALDYDEIVRYLRDVYRAAHVTIHEIRQHTGLTQAGFSRRFAVPKRTVEDWERGARECPPYVRALLAQAAGMVNIF